MLSESALLTATQPFPRWEDLQPIWGGLIPRVVQAILVLFLTMVLARTSRNAFLKAAAKSKADINTRYLVARLLVLAILFLGLATVLAIFDVPLSAVVTFVGVVGLGVSLALQDILKNFFAGLYLLFERPFRIGEDIRVREFEGRVEDVGVRTTTLRASDNVQVLIPNAVVFAEVVLNRTYARSESLATQPAPSGTGASQPARAEGVIGVSAAPTLPESKVLAEEQPPQSPPPEIVP